MGKAKPKDWDPPALVDMEPKNVRYDPSAWVETWTGRRLYPQAPAPEMFNILDIAHGLSQINRFLGATTAPYTVAQHSVLVSRACLERDALAGLLHDAAETYVGDIPRPVKACIPQFKAMEDNILRVCAGVYGFEFPLPVSVDRADRDLLATEWRDLMKTDPPAWPFETVPLEEVITPWDADTSEEKFLERYNELTGSGVRAPQL